MELNLLYASIGAGVIALLFAFWKTAWINKQDPGTDKMKEIGAAIREGAMAYLMRQYKVLAIFAVSVALLLTLANKDYVRLAGVAFIFGAFCSVIAGFFGMRVATAANMRTTNSARKGLSQALGVAFAGGSVMGMCVVGIGVLGISSLLLLAWHGIVVPGVEKGDVATNLLKNAVLPILNGFAMGVSSIALFARVGGGIYTKAADVGADLVGKVEAGIPEDSPRNPATIADNVGDNVGDVAGMGADLFESYVGAIFGTMILGAVTNEFILVVLPLVLAGAGIIFSILGTFLVRTKEGGNPQTALNLGTFGAGIAMAIATLPILLWLIPKEGIPVAGGVTITATGLFIATIVGLAAGIAIGLITEFYTALNNKPVAAIAKASETGAGTNIISGLSTGMMSTAAPTIVICIAIFVAHTFSGLYGIAIAALGMLATTGIQLAVDAYGPIADNAGGLAEMAELDKEVRHRTDKLDAVGNTTAAIGKGFAIGSAALTALALFSAFRESYKVISGKEVSMNITDPNVVIGLLIGATLPFIFSAFAMGAVGRAALSMVEEVRRQFKNIPGLLEGTGKADYARCVDISTQAAIREMVTPGLIAVLTPIVIGLVGGPSMLGGVLAGVMASGVMMALFMANAGGAWDNAKKFIEGGAHGGKGSAPHKAAVIGDTVGDPFKDTAGPSLNTLMKLICIVSLVMVPIIASPWAQALRKILRIEGVE